MDPQALLWRGGVVMFALALVFALPLPFDRREVRA
jgi:hypothetical protein